MTPEIASGSAGLIVGSKGKLYHHQNELEMWRSIAVTVQLLQLLGTLH